MKQITEVLLRAFLRRYPLPTRLNLFGYLGQYAWLRDILEELRPELFPSPEEAAVPVVAPEQATPPLDSRILGFLEQGEVRGQVGYYKAETYWGQRGRGHLFKATDVTSKRAVTIKEFLLPASEFSKTEALQRQNRFKRLAGLQLADGRFQDFRVLQPIEAIADTESHERCFLITDEQDLAPTLGQQLQTCGPLSPEQSRDIVSQLLQTLDFLHNQKFSLPSGAIQNGLIHGNLSLDSILWTGPLRSPFVYVSDLLVWEQCFDPAALQGRSIQATAATIQQDLQAVGAVGMALLQGEQPGTASPIDPDFQQILAGLQTGKFNSAETARRQLLQLAPRSPSALQPLEEERAQPKARDRFSPLLLLSLIGLLAGALALWPRLRPTQARVVPPPRVSTCCLQEVSAIPAGEFLYTSVEAGTWWTVLQQHHLLQRNQGLTDALTLAQPKLKLNYMPSASIDEALQQVRSGAVDFAVLPQIDELPGDLLAQEIAYDGLATVVSFSYAKRQQGLPQTLRGELSLEQVRQIFNGKVDRWTMVGGPNLRVRRYASKNPEAIALFERRVLKTGTLQNLTTVQRLPSLDLLRQVIRDFEAEDIGSIGFAPLSETWGQCSVYPLALKQTAAAVQPLVLSNGQAIDPATDLCDRKGAYGPDPERFQTGDYPLSYPILVIYPRDNRRSAVGKKFVELMRTIEGQRLLRAAGLVPLSRDLASQPPKN